MKFGYAAIFATLCILVVYPFVSGAKLFEKNPGLDLECAEILTLLSEMEGFDYSNVSIAKQLFGNEKINFEVKTWRGKCYYGIGTLNGKVVIVSNKLFKHPTILAYTDSYTVKYLFRNPSEKLFENALATGRIKIKGAGLLDGIRIGMLDFLRTLYFRGREENVTSNVSSEIALNLSWSDDLDGDGVLNSEDECDPYLLRKNLAEEGRISSSAEVKYYTCPFLLFREEYTGSSPYTDIYGYVLENGCGVKDTDGGIRYYTKGFVCIEDVKFVEQNKKDAFSIERKKGKIVSECKKVYEDYCIDNETLVEFYYEPPRSVVYNHPIFGIQRVEISGRITNKTYKCPFGCRNGACICEDVDAGPGLTREDRGKNYEKKGHYERDILEKFDFYNTYPNFHKNYLNDGCKSNSEYEEWYATVVSTAPYVTRLPEDKCILKREIIPCPGGCDMSTGKCLKESCANGIKDEGEDGVDCGGSCPPCNTKCTTSAVYAPPDTPCTKKWTPPQGSNDKITACEVFEVCDEFADKYIKEALACCDSGFRSLDYDVVTCNYAKSGTPENLSRSDYIKRCAGLYIIYNLGSSRIVNENKIMNFYMREELCCDNPNGSLCYKDTDFQTYLYNCVSDDRSNFWSCWDSAARHVRNQGDYDLYEKVMERINYAMGEWDIDDIPCTNYSLPKRWGDDTDPSKNTIKFSHLPSHATLRYLRTGTCADYAIAVTTLLRKLGYRCDEVYFVSSPYSVHAFNFVKLPGDRKYHLVDTTGGDAGGIRIGGMWARSKSSIDYNNCKINWLSVCDRINQTVVTKLRELYEKTGNEDLNPKGDTKIKNDCTGDYITPISPDMLYGCEEPSIDLERLEENCG